MFSIFTTLLAWTAAVVENNKKSRLASKLLGKKTLAPLGNSPHEDLTIRLGSSLLNATTLLPLLGNQAQLKMLLK
jgi:hypothetical protein